MKFCCITLKGIRNFEEKTIQFWDGLNIVCGPNESGKSTIVDSLVYLITGDRSEIPSLIKWETDYSSANIQYETDTDETFILTRDIYPEEKIRLENNVIIENPEVISHMLKEHFGSTSQLVLENSAVVKHNEMEIMRKMGSRNTIKKQIQTVLSGSVEKTTEEVIEILERSVFQLERSLVEIENEIEEVLKRFEPYKGIDEQYNTINNKKMVYEEDLEKYKEKLDIYKDRLHYGDLVEEIKEKKRLLDRIEDINSYIRSIPFETLETIKELCIRLKEIEEDKKGIQSLIEVREQELQNLEEELQKEYSFFGRLIKSLTKKPKTKEEIERKVEIVKKLLEDNKKQLQERNMDYSNFQTEIRDYECQIGSFKGKSVEELTYIKEEYEKERAALLQGLTPDEVTAAIIQKENERDNLRSIIFRENPELLKKGSNQILYEKEELERKITLLTEEIKTVDKELFIINTKKGEKDIIQQDLNLLQSRKEEVTLKKEVDQITLAAIKEVYADLKEQVIPQVEEKAGAILQKITRGKYKTIAINKDDLTITVEMPDKTVDTVSLSQGTKDQLFLSVRIALSEVLSGGRRLPLLFDESFYTSDENRLRETFAVLKEIARNTQVILFTHNEGFLKYGSPIMLGTDKETVQQVY